MLFDTTYKSEERDQIINTLVGPVFPLRERLKRKSIGSKRMIVEEVSNELTITLNESSDLNYGNIELRPNGVLIHLIKGLQNFAWGIPYYQLHTYHSDGFSIHAQGEFIRFRNNRMIRDNKKFFELLAEEKIKYLEQYRAPFMS